MKYADTERFQGSLSHEDPRTNVTAAGGSIWPTVPPYRMKLGAYNAEGVLAFINTKGLLFEQISPIKNHDEMFWIGSDNPIEVGGALAKRWYTYPNDHYTWLLQVFLRASVQPLIVEWERPYEKTNIDMPVPPTYLGNPVVGYTGDEPFLYQVEWNETDPPWGWPPVIPNGP